MGYLGQVTQRGSADPDNPVLAGGYTVTFDPAQLPRVDAEVYHIAIKGPSGSSFDVYIDTTFYDTVARGDKNSWDPSQPMHIAPGSTIYFYYDTASGTVPMATLFFRSSTPF